jgi:hypothetical protein
METNKNKFSINDFAKQPEKDLDARNVENPAVSAIKTI